MQLKHIVSLLFRKNPDLSIREQHAGAGKQKTEYITLTKFIMAEQKKIPHATGDFTQLLNSLQTVVKIVDIAVRKAGITQLFGLHGTTNFHGQLLRKLDVLSNELFINMLSSSYTVGAMVSEENEKIIEVAPETRGKYLVCFDPLDGASNLDCLASIGSTFGIYKLEHNDNPTVNDFLLPGRRLVSAGYALYGSATAIVLCSGSGVNGFMLDHSIGEFLLTDPNMKIPKKGRFYSVNEGHRASWQEAVKQYVDSKKDPSKNKPCSLRYVGSLVPDIHRTLKFGGIFIHPTTEKSPAGKLRLLYECNPMAFIVEHAGGAATDGYNPILDLVPDQIHHRTPFFIGSQEDVSELIQTFKQFQPKQ